MIEGEPKIENVQENPEQNNQEKDIDGLRDYYGKVFDKYQDGEERIKDVLTGIRAFLESEKTGLNKEEIARMVKECSLIEDRDVFADRIVGATKEIYNFIRDNPELRLEIVMESAGYKKLNRCLYYMYGDDKKSVGIHLAPSEELGIAEVKRLVLEGLGDLAQILQEHPEIDKVTARSWIVGKKLGTKLMERLGFKVDEKSGEKVDDSRALGQEEKSAEISSKDFLAKYGKKQK